jgi:hypothetical protein
MVTNNILVTNILRGRDGAPLYFSDLSQIRGSVQVNWQAQTTVPYGQLFASTMRRSFQAGPLAVNNQPGFDFAPLNTKNFAQGMLTGINVNVFAYFIQRGVNPRVFLNLVVSKIEAYQKVDNGYRLLETCARNCLDEEFALWTSDATRLPTIGVSSDSSDIVPAIDGGEFIKIKNALTSVVQAEGAGIKVETAKDGKVHLKKSSSKNVLCVLSQTGGYQAIGITAPGAAKTPSSPDVVKDDNACAKGHRARAHSRPVDFCSATIRCVLYVRSVEAIFYYLGTVVRDPDHAAIPFRLYDQPADPVRFSVNYRGQNYYVREVVPGDATLTILAILNDLLNLNRDANEIPSTKTVATAP